MSRVADLVPRKDKSKPLGKGPPATPAVPAARGEPPWVVKAQERGAADRAAGKRRDECPYPRDQRPEVRGWLAGWDAAPDPKALDRMIPAAPANRAAKPEPDPRWYAAPGADVSQPVYRPPFSPLVACPSCRRIRLDHGSQACLVDGIHGGVAYMRCRACNHRFKAPILPGPEGGSAPTPPRR